MIDFDWSFRFGDVLTVLGAAFVGGTMLYKRGRLEGEGGRLMQGIAQEIEEMKDELKELAKVITALAVQDIKINNMSEQFTMLHRTVEDLRRGGGYVKTRSVIDGEY